MGYRLHAAVVVLVTAASFFSASADEIPSYAARPVSLPNAGYVDQDGAVVVIGYNDMESQLAAINHLFTAAHPNIRFRMVLKGTRTAPPALADGLSAYAPMGAPFSPEELRRYRAKTGDDPLMFRVAHASMSPDAKSGPLGVLVADTNPITALTLEQVALAFADPAPVPWGALGLKGTAGQAPVRRVGLKADTALGRFMLDRIQRSEFAPDFQGLAQSRDVVSAVSADPLAIGFAAANLVRPGVRLVPLLVNAKAAPVIPTEVTLRAGQYPLDRHLYIFVRRPVEPLVAEYLRLVLSREGQNAIADDPLGYIPLSAAELHAERAKLPQ